MKLYCLANNFFYYPASYLSKIPCVQTNLEDDSETVKEKFNDLLAVLLRNWADRRDQEELSIMNN